MKNTIFTNNELLIIIILMIYSVIREFITYNDTNLNTIELNIANIVYLVFGYYLLIIKKVHGSIFIIYSLYLITKGILHFLYIFKLYKLLGFNKEIEERYVNFAVYSNIIGGILSLLILSKIFFF